MGLGVVNVDKMLRSLTAGQLLEWEAYMEIEPFGELKADYRAAHIVQMIHNVAVSKEHQRPLKDFLLKFEEEEAKPKKQPWKLQGAMLEMIFMAGTARG